MEIRNQSRTFTRQTCLRCFGDIENGQCPNARCLNHTKQLEDDSANISDGEQLRRIVISIPIVLDIFQDGAVRKFIIDRGLPEDYEIVKVCHDQHYRLDHIEVLVRGRFTDGGKNGDSFNILVTSDTNV